MQPNDVLESCLQIYSQYMEQVNYSDCEDLCEVHFEDAHDTASTRAHRALHAQLGASAAEQWGNLLDERIQRCRQSHRQTFERHLLGAQKQFNQNLLDEYVNNFVVLLPWSYDVSAEKFLAFDAPKGPTLRSLCEQSYKECARGDETMKSNFTVKLLEKLAPIQADFDEYGIGLYTDRHNFRQRWQKKATKEQNLLASALLAQSMWNEIKMDSDCHQVKKLVSFILLGKMTNEGYERHRGLIDHFISSMRKYSISDAQGEHIFKFAIVFVHSMNLNTLRTILRPVFRINTGRGNRPDQCVFMDHLGNVYNAWRDLIQAHLDFDYTVLAPVDGEYVQKRNGQVELTLDEPGFWFSPRFIYSQSFFCSEPVPLSTMDYIIGSRIGCSGEFHWRQNQKHADETVELLLHLTGYWAHGEFPRIDDVCDFIT